MGLSVLSRGGSIGQRKPTHGLHSTAHCSVRPARIPAASRGRLIRYRTAHICWLLPRPRGGRGAWCDGLAISRDLRLYPMDAGLYIRHCVQPHQGQRRRRGSTPAFVVEGLTEELYRTAVTDHGRLPPPARSLNCPSSPTPAPSPQVPNIDGSSEIPPHANTSHLPEVGLAQAGTGWQEGKRTYALVSKPLLGLGSKCGRIWAWWAAVVHSSFSPTVQALVAERHCITRRLSLSPCK